MMMVVTVMAVALHLNPTLRGNPARCQIKTCDRSVAAGG